MLTVGWRAGWLRLGRLDESDSIRRPQKVTGVSGARRSRNSLPKTEVRGRSEKADDNKNKKTELYSAQIINWTHL